VVNIQSKGPKILLHLKGGFLIQAEKQCGNSPQTLSLAFIVGFSGVLQLKNTNIRLTKNVYLVIFKSGHDLYLHEQKNEEQPGGFAERISKNDVTERL